MERSTEMKERGNGMEWTIIARKWVWINNNSATNKQKHNAW